MDNIGIKIKTQGQLAACVKVLKGYTEKSMGEIKTAIENNDFVYECRFVDGNGIKKLISIYKELSAANIETEIYEHGRLTDVEFLLNLTNSYVGIDADVDRMIDEEIDG